MLMHAQLGCNQSACNNGCLADLALNVYMVYEKYGTLKSSMRSKPNELQPMHMLSATSFDRGAEVVVG